MAIQKPAWVGSLALIWIIVIPGIILTHMALAELEEPLKELANNIVKGFDEIFKFEYLEEDAEKVEKSSADAVAKCGENATIVCPQIKSGTPPTGIATNTLVINTTQEKNDISAAFDHSLTMVKKIASDKYFGLDDFDDTEKALTEIQTITDQLPTSTPCNAAIPAFCETFDSAKDIVGGMDEVTEAIDSFKDSDIIKNYDSYKHYVNLLNALPYFMVIALLFFTYFFKQGAACCCCHGGTVRGSLMLFPCAICWLIAFVIWAVICGAGIAVHVLQNDIEVSALKNNPTVKEAIDHIQTEFPEFWDVVFADLEDGLKEIYFASWFIIVTAILILLFTCSVCICHPYRDSGDKAATAENAEKASG